MFFGIWGKEQPIWSRFGALKVSIKLQTADPQVSIELQNESPGVARALLCASVEADIFLREGAGEG